MKSLYIYLELKIYIIWLSAPNSSNISVPHILFLTLNWGYNDTMGQTVFNGLGHCFGSLLAKLLEV